MDGGRGRRVQKRQSQAITLCIQRDHRRTAFVIDRPLVHANAHVCVLGETIGENALNHGVDPHLAGASRRAVAHEPRAAIFDEAALAHPATERTR